MKPPKQYPNLFADVLTPEWPDPPAGEPWPEGVGFDPIPPDAETIMQRLRADAERYLGLEGLPANAHADLRLLVELTLRTDAAALFMAGKLAQRVIYAMPMIDGLRKIQKGSKAGKTGAEANAKLRATKAEKAGDVWAGEAKKLLAKGHERHTIVQRLLKRKGAPSLATINRYLKAAGI